MKKMNLKAILIAALAVAVVAAQSGCGKTEDGESVMNQEVGALAANENNTDNSQTAQELSLSANKATYANSTEITLTKSCEITKGGSYFLSGKVTDGQILVDTEDEVELILGGVDITNSTGPAIYIKSAKNVTIILADGSENKLCDGAGYVLAEGEDEPNAALFSKADMTFSGNGRLVVSGNYRHGILSKDSLVIEDGDFSITAVEHGIRGRDSVEINGGNFVIVSGEDGIQSNNDKDVGKGFVKISGGKFNITAGNDAVQAETALTISGGDFQIKTGDGADSVEFKVGDKGMGGRGFNFADTLTESEEEAEPTVSNKGLKAGTDITVSAGSFTFDTVDDSVHANNVTIDGGKFAIKSGDDAIHADAKLVVNDIELTVEKCYEGLEGSDIEINGGNIVITAADDAINAAGDLPEVARGWQLTINDGYLSLTSENGDVVDSNANFNMNGGTVLASGYSNGNSALDFDGAGVVNGGVVVATGSSSMAQSFGDSSTQCTVATRLDSTAQAGTRITLTDSTGNIIVSAVPTTNFEHIVISSPKLAIGQTYTLYTGGTVESADQFGYTDSGVFATGTDGEKVSEIAQESISVGGSFGGFGGMGGNHGERPEGTGKGNRQKPTATDANGEMVMPEGFDPANFDPANMPEGFEPPNMPQN